MAIDRIGGAADIADIGERPQTGELLFNCRREQAFVDANVANTGLGDFHKAPSRSEY